MKIGQFSINIDHILIKIDLFLINVVNLYVIIDLNVENCELKHQITSK